MDPNLNAQNQKSLFKGGSFLDQEDDDFRKDRFHISDKEINSNIFSKPMFYDSNENNFWNRNKNNHNHSNIIQDYLCQNVDQTFRNFALSPTNYNLAG